LYLGTKLHGVTLNYKATSEQAVTVVHLVSGSAFLPIVVAAAAAAAAAVVVVAAVGIGSQTVGTLLAAMLSSAFSAQGHYSTI
jgi:translation elongation factor EF-4